MKNRKLFYADDALKAIKSIRGARKLVMEHGISLARIVRGMNVEREHGSRFGRVTNVTHDSAKITAKIALAHLLEDHDYYKKLAAMERDNERNTGHSRVWVGGYIRVDGIRVRGHYRRPFSTR